MQKSPVVEFTVRLSDLRKAQKHLLVNRETFEEKDCADLLVSSCATTFRSVGTMHEAPVSGSQPGTVSAAQNI